ncbi:MAG: hypothetical protein CME33_23555 [Gimesia sp.]|nr:hypothetical protein [Gimesia sp.]
MPHKWRKRKSEYSEQAVQTDLGTYVCFTVRGDEPSAEGSITVADPRPTAKRFSSINREYLAFRTLFYGHFIVLTARLQGAR